ncbi:MAG: hypothetical protein LBL90_08370 [Prevotellaceae bacterium]|jgi:hypothetical protein|nr:hypothetical protein [Prevotellaceae bacterium]
MSQPISILITVIIILIFLTIIGFVSKGLSSSKVIRHIDKSLSKSHFSQVFILAFFIVFVFAFFVFLSASINPVENESYSVRFWNALSHFFNPGAFNKEDGLSNGWIMLINIFGMVLMTGLLISVLSNLLERRVDNLKNGRISYKFKNHLVIIGYDKMTISLIKQLIKEYPDCDIVLQTVQDVPTVRHYLYSYLNNEIENNVILLNGNRNSKEDLEKLYLSKAIRLLILGENNEYDHDSLNIECLKKINKILNEEKSETEKSCYVLFENQSTYSILQQQDLMELVNGEDDKICKNKIEFHPFNFQELWSQKVFVDNCYSCPNDEIENIQYQPLDRTGIDYHSDKTVHLVILGMSKMGVALGIQASHLCHFPNFIRDKKLKTKITFIDENADQEMHYLQSRYRYLFQEIDYSYEDTKYSTQNFNNQNIANTKGETEKFTDIEWHFIKGRIEEPVIRQKLIEYSKENTSLTISICLNSPTEAINSGLYLPDEIYRDDIQMLIKQDTPYSILSMLKDNKKYKNVKPFGMLDNCLDISDSDCKDILAKRVHYVYDYYFNEKTYKQIPQTIPMNEQLNNGWIRIPTVEKWSNRYHANMINVKERSFNISELDHIVEEKKLDMINLIDLIAKVEHNRWNTEKLLMGFRPPTKTEIEKGESKKELKKIFIHPDIAPFNDIPEDMKDVDRLITKVLPLIIRN